MVSSTSEALKGTLSRQEIVPSRKSSLIARMYFGSKLFSRNHLCTKGAKV